MTFTDIIREKIVGKEIDITGLHLEVEDGTHIRYPKAGEISGKLAYVTDVYDIFSGENYCIGVHATMKDKKLVLTLSDETDIKIFTKY